MELIGVRMKFNCRKKFLRELPYSFNRELTKPLFQTYGMQISPGLIHHV